MLEASKWHAHRYSDSVPAVLAGALGTTLLSTCGLVRMGRRARNSATANYSCVFGTRTWTLGEPTLLTARPLFRNRAPVWHTMPLCENSCVPLELRPWRTMRMSQVRFLLLCISFLWTAAQDRRARYLLIPIYTRNPNNLIELLKT